MDGTNRRTGRQKKKRKTKNFVRLLLLPALLARSLLVGSSWSQLDRLEASFSKRGKMWQVKKFEIRCLLFAGGPTSRL